MEKYTEKLPVTLSEEEKQVIAEELTLLEIRLAAIEKNKAEYNKDVNEQIKSLKLQALELSQKYQAEGELHEVECYFVFDQPEAGLKTIYRSDTGEMIRVTDMNIFDVPNHAPNNPMGISQLMLNAPEEVEFEEEVEISDENP